MSTHELEIAQADHDALASMVTDDEANGQEMTEADKQAAAELLEENVNRFKAAKAELAARALNGQVEVNEPFPAKETSFNHNHEQLVASNYLQAFEDSHNVTKR